MSGNLIDNFIARMEKDVEDGVPLPPETWLERALKLNVLLGKENIKLFSLESELAKQRAKLLAQGDMPVSKANVIIEAEDKYREYQILKAKIKQVEEFIRIAKNYSKAISNEYNAH